MESKVLFRSKSLQKLKYPLRPSATWNPGLAPGTKEGHQWKNPINPDEVPVNRNTLVSIA